MSFNQLEIKGNPTEDIVNINESNPAVGGTDIVVKWASDDVMVGPGPIPNIPATDVSAYIDTDDLLGFVDACSTNIAQELNHAYLDDDSLVWEQCGHVSGEDVPTVACFNADGDPITKTLPNLAGDFSHSDLGGLVWEECGHVSGEEIPTVACFNTEGVAVARTIAGLAADLVEEISHTSLQDLKWVDSGHYADEDEIPFAKVAGFNTFGTALTFTLPVLALNLQQYIDHDKMDNLEWDNCGHTGTPGTIAAFTEVDGYATEISPQNIVDAAVIDHAALDNLAWEDCGHTGDPNTIAVFDGYGNAVCGNPNDLIDFTDIEVAIEDVATAAATAIAAIFYPAFKMPVISDSGIEWMEMGDSSSGSQALIGGNITYSAHYQEGPVETFDGLATTITAAAASGNSTSYALYDTDANGKPHNLLWYSATVSTTTSGVKTATFAGGTWTTAGASYKDGSNNLVLARGQTVYKAMFASSNLSYRVISDCRSLGRGMNATTKPYTGFKESATYPTFPGTATPVVQTSQLPVCPLHRA